MPKKPNPAVAQMWSEAGNSRLETEIDLLKQELAELRASQSGLTLYPIDQFTPLRLPQGLTQPRKYFAPQGMAKLKQSISRVGVQEALLVRPAPDGKLEIVSGERRWRCALELQLSELPAIPKELSDEDALEIALVANLMREDLSPIEETDSIVALLGLKLHLGREQLPPFLIKIRNLRMRYQKSDAEIAADIEADGGDFSGKISADSISAVDGILDGFGIGLVGFVTNRLNPLQKMPEILLNAVRAGQVDLSKADLIRKAPEDEQAALLEAVCSEGLTKAAVAERVKALNSSGADAQLDIRDLIHRSYGRIRRRANWSQLEADPKLKRKLRRLDTLLKELVDELGPDNAS
jgi:ParB family chromosome partitioning protein